MRARAVVGFLPLLLGCSGQPAPVAPPPPEPSVSTPPPQPEPPEPTVAETPALPNEILEPTDVACRIVEKAWDQNKLHLRANLPSFGAAIGAPTTLLLPTIDKPKEAIAVMDDGRVLIRAVIPSSAVSLYMPKPTALLGILTLESDAAAGWVSTKPGSVRIGVDASSVLITPDPFEVELACESVGIMETKYDARATITKQKNLQKRETSRDGVEISSSLKGSSSGTLKGGVEVELVENKGADVRILIKQNGYFVSGWVAKKDLLPPSHGMGYGVGRGVGLNRSVSQMVPLTRCKDDVALYVEQGAERVKVGVLHNGAGFYLSSNKDAKAPFVTFDVPGSNWLWMNESAKLVLEAASIARCDREPSGVY